MRITPEEDRKYNIRDRKKVIKGYDRWKKKDII